MGTWRRSTEFVLILAALCLGAAPTSAQDWQARRAAMVDSQIAARGVDDPAVLDAMRQVPRHLFVPPSWRFMAYDDRPLPIGQGQTISQPFIVAYMTQALAIKPGDKVLEIGTGSGYQAAVLARLGARVYSIEIVPELARDSAARLAELGYDVRVRLGDGHLGWPEEAPFQAVIGTAAAGRVPPALVDQLAPGGRMVIPVGPAGWVQELVLLRKDARGRLFREKLLDVRFVPMTGGGPSNGEKE